MADVKINVDVQLFIEEFVDTVKKTVKDRLMKFGAIVRQNDRSSIKPVSLKAAKLAGGKEVYSQPGKPPLSKFGFLRELIFYAWDPVSETVVIGPKKIRNTNAPAVLEYGGKQTVQTGKGVKRHTETVNILARPHTNPALEKAAKRLPQIFKNCLKT
jgi:hypothetical protein